MRRMLSRSPIAIAALALLVAVGALAIAQSAPTLFNFQGRLTNPAGAPVTAATGLQISLIRGGTATEVVSTGAVVYQETATVTPGSNGVFTHVIGTGAPVGGQTLIEADFDTSGIALYIELSISGEVLLPRTRVLSTPYAIEASRLGGMTAQTIIGQTGGNAFANAVVRSGAGLEWISASQIRVNAGTLGFSDGIVRRNTSLLPWGFLNGVGPLGLDAGTEAANTWYYLYAIPDPLDDTKFSAVASIATPAETGGAGPTGYPLHRYLGAFRNDGSSNIVRFLQDGARFQYADPTYVLAQGSMTPDTAWVTQSLVVHVPVTARIALIQGKVDTAGSQILQLFLSGVSGVLAYHAQANSVDNTGDATDIATWGIPLFTPQTIFRNARVINGSGTLNYVEIRCMGWEDGNLE